ncbi:MAG: AAA family ATPase [Chloroflexi bacterium]|nr:AAA family ATPase [Chloroflexota bacterium]
MTEKQVDSREHRIDQDDPLLKSLVGREAELNLLQAVWQQAQTGKGKLVLLSGEYGVGKKRLLEVFGTYVESQGGQVIRGECVEGSGLAYRPWLNVLHELVRQVEDASEMGIKRVAPVLATLLPDLWDRPYMTDIEQPVGLDPRAEQQRLNDTIVQVLWVAASLQPTMIVIKDGQWADEATLVLLEYLARVLGRAGLMVCISYCDDEIKSDQRLAMLAGDQVQRVPVEPLSPKGVAALIQSELGMGEPPEMLVEQVWQATRGNAFFARELVCSLMEDGDLLRQTVTGWQLDEVAFRKMTLPADIRVLAQHCLERSSEETRQVLGWAAVSGTVFWGGLLAEIGQISTAQVGIALTECLGRGLIVARTTSMLEGEREYAFANVVVRELISEGVSREEKQKLHNQIAVWLMSRGEIDKHLGLIAYHFEQAGEREQALDYLRWAGELAASQFAGVEAVDYFSRALVLLREDERVERYGLIRARERVHELRGARDAQWQDLIALRTLAEEMDDNAQLHATGSRRAKVALRRAIYAEDTGDYPAAIAAAQEAVSLAQTAGDVSSEMTGYVRWGRATWLHGRYKEASQPLRQSLALAEDEGALEVKAISLHNLATVSYFRGHFARAIAYNEQALHVFRELGRLEKQSRIYNNLGMIYTRLGSYVEGKHYLDQGLHISREVGYKMMEASLLQDLSTLYNRLGDDEIAFSYAQESLSIADQIDSLYLKSYACMSMGHVMMGLGHLDEAVRVYQWALNVRRDLGQINLTMDVLAGLARVSLAKSDLAQALAYCEEILTHLETGTLDGTDDPLLIYMTCYHVLQVSKNPRADEILSVAHSLLLEQADRINDAQLRRSYLENVAAHREVQDLVAGKDLESAVVYVPNLEAKREDDAKSKDRLIEELAGMRRRMAALKAARVRYKQVEETLWESEKHFRSIVETASDAVFIFNMEENIFFWNQAAHSIFGYSVDEVKGQLLTSILTEEFQQMLRQDMQQVVATGISGLIGKKIDVMGLRKNGVEGALEEFPLELSLTTWRAKEEVYFAAIGHDITNREEAREALEQAYAEVEKRVEERTVQLQQVTVEREHLQQDIIDAQKHTLQELSTPVIPVTKDIIVMPLVGSIDTMRARDITRRLLSGIRSHRAQAVILDITGVSIVDTGVANHLNKTIQAARLKGARTIISGISDAVAETIVDLGIDWEDIETVSDLQTGLRVALTTMGLQIEKIPDTE